MACPLPYLSALGASTVSSFCRVHLYVWLSEVSDVVHLRSCCKYFRGDAFLVQLQSTLANESVVSFSSGQTVHLDPDWDALMRYRMVRYLKVSRFVFFASERNPTHAESRRVKEYWSLFPVIIHNEGLHKFDVVLRGEVFRFILPLRYPYYQPIITWSRRQELTRCACFVVVGESTTATCGYAKGEVTFDFWSPAFLLRDIANAIEASLPERLLRDVANVDCN